jgi:hypothetical protein
MMQTRVRSGTAAAADPSMAAVGLGGGEWVSGDLFVKFYSLQLAGRSLGWLKWWSRVSYFWLKLLFFLSLIYYNFSRCI